MKHLLVLLSFWSHGYLVAQAIQQKLSSPFSPTAVYSSAFIDVLSGTANQAALASLEAPAFGIVGERRFMLAEMTQLTGLVTLPAGQAVIALQADYFGGQSYNETMLGFAYGRKVSSEIQVGAKLNWYNMRMAGYGNAASFNFEAGILVHLTKQLHAGFHMYNPFGSPVGKVHERLPSIFKAGFGYQGSEKLFVGAEIVRRENLPVCLQVGLQYKAHERLIFRGGVSTINTGHYAGIGLVLGQLRIDIQVGYHQQLGFTPGFGLLYNLENAGVD
ncbi:hypothetical protein EXU57_20425 [Segetibacter sp. 3557_3]|uniref:hypothetical protein n=1 Tax=Segetibacter sp. 3557_3 TaxID=2547429 RepID=UPI0010591F20|nr:hypothetical protein [Segetibacter sp. 3557_3]TDH21305.1 hypothetical protein EXU57_20425 [Segetibacter sp. 3557_3]